MPQDLVNIHDAKTHFSKLIERVQRGEEIVIARAGKPVARLTPIQPPPAQRPKPGYGKGTIQIADDFNAPMPDDWLDEFENSPIFPEPRDK